MLTVGNVRGQDLAAGREDPRVSLSRVLDATAMSRLGWRQTVSCSFIRYFWMPFLMLVVNIRRGGVGCHWAWMRDGTVTSTAFGVDGQLLCHSVSLDVVSNACCKQ
jgi:hypothetical protein